MVKSKGYSTAFGGPLQLRTSYVRAPTPTPFPLLVATGDGSSLSRLSCHIGFMGHIYSSSCNIYLSSHMELLPTGREIVLVGGYGLFDVTQETYRIVRVKSITLA